jgi:hypothetical protein
LANQGLSTQYNYWWPVGFLFWQEVLESQISIIQLKAQAETFTIRQKKKKKKKKPTMKSRLSSMFFKTFTQPSRSSIDTLQSIVYNHVG